MKYLKGHVSPETAYVVDDYPYGFRLRCKIRYWLEYHPKKGFRLVSQTTNPKVAGEVWNKPKASTYARGIAVMLLDDDNGHVSWTVTRYDDGETAKLREAFKHCRDYLPAEAIPEAEKYLRIKTRYDELKATGLDYRIAARLATVEEAQGKLITIIIDVCIAGNPAINGHCGDKDCVCEVQP